MILVPTTRGRAASASVAAGPVGFDRQTPVLIVMCLMTV
jgi:hypothetical protein